MKAIDIIEVLQKWIPDNLIDRWDNTGFQIGNPDTRVEKVLVALDLDKDVLDKAIKENFQMVITHHPLIFKPLSEITTMDYKGSVITKAIKNDIVIFNAHSNLDLAIGGVNDELANELGLKNTIPLTQILKDGFEKDKIGYGRVGTVDNIPFNKFLDLLKSKLNTSDLIVYGEKKKYIKNVAVCGGSGSDFIKDAYNHNVDIYITGDIKYHDAQLAHELGLLLVDAGHFHTEKIILPTIKKYIDKELNGFIEVKVIMESSIPKFIY